MQLCAVACPCCQPPVQFMSALLSAHCSCCWLSMGGHETVICLVHALMGRGNMCLWSLLHNSEAHPLFDQDRDAVALLGPLPQEAVDLQAGLGQGCLPVTRGSRPRDNLFWCWVLFAEADRKQQLSWLHSLSPEVKWC